MLWYEMLFHVVVWDVISCCGWCCGTMENNCVPKQNRSRYSYYIRTNYVIDADMKRQSCDDTLIYKPFSAYLRIVFFGPAMWGCRNVRMQKCEDAEMWVCRNVRMQKCVWGNNINVTNIFKGVEAVCTMMLSNVSAGAWHHCSDGFKVDPKSVDNIVYKHDKGYRVYICIALIK